MFCKPEVREGVLPRLLKEILETRILIKNAMKRAKDNKVSSSLGCPANFFNNFSFALIPGSLQKTECTTVWSENDC